MAPVPGRRYVSASVLLYLLVQRGMFEPADLLKRPPHNELLSLLAVNHQWRMRPLQSAPVAQLHVVMHVPWASLP